MMTPASSDLHRCECEPPQALVALIGEHSRFLLLGHRNPDGDAVGSALALAQVLRQLGKRVEVCFPSPPPDWWVHVPGGDLVTETPGTDVDVAIALDCADLSRLGDALALLNAASVCVEIDHHDGGERNCPVRYVDPSAAAVGVMIYRLLPFLGADLTSEIATCIYWAVAADTGFFRFGNTNAEALATCADCVRCGARPDEIARHAVGTKPIEHLVLKGRALAVLERHLGGMALTSVIGPADFRAAGAARRHCDEIIDDIRTATGGVFFALLKAPDSDTDWEVSLRSKAVDCAALAARFGGGGHAEAAGYSFEGPVEDVRDSLLRLVSPLLTTDVTT